MTIQAQSNGGETLFTLGMGTIMSVLIIIITALGGWCLNLQSSDSIHTTKIAVLEQVNKSTDASICELKKDIASLVKGREEDRALLQEIRKSQKVRGF